MFPYAPHPDLYRSLEKDASIVSSLRDNLHDLALHTTPSSQRYQREIDAFSYAIYQSITRLRGKPTLGEEYCDLVPVTVSHTRPNQQQLESSNTTSNQLTTSPSITAQPTPNQSVDAQSNEQWRLPSQYDRRKHFVLTAILPYMFERSRVAALHATDGINQSRHMTARERFVLNLSKFLSFVDRCLPTLNRFHLAVFFLTGHFLSWADRLSGTRYVHIRALDSPRPKYATLGALMLIQMTGTGIGELGRILIAWHRHRQRDRNAGRLNEGENNEFDEEEDVEAIDEPSEDEAEDEDGVPARQCLLHLGPLRAPTALLCGHVMCWRCLAECGKQKPECPLCRAPFRLEELLRLAIYG